MDKTKFNRAAKDPSQLQKFVDEAIDAISNAGGKTPSFTATTFEIDLPDVDIQLSAEDCTDITKNKYPVINVVANMGEEESITLTFVCNNVADRIEKGEKFTYAQYILIVDDDENVYDMGLSFSSKESVNSSWAMKINGGAEGGKLYQHNVLFTDPDSGQSVSIAYVCSRAESFTTPSDFLGYISASDAPHLTYGIVGGYIFAPVGSYTSTGITFHWREFNASEGSYVTTSISLGTEGMIPWETLTDTVKEL